jgi:hypothetical protein
VKPTGDGEREQYHILALEAEAAINKRSGEKSHLEDEEDLSESESETPAPSRAKAKSVIQIEDSDEDSDAGSVKIVASKSKSKVVKGYKVEAPLTTARRAPRNNSSASATAALATITQALDPTTLQNREESRHFSNYQTMRIQALESENRELRDKYTEVSVELRTLKRLQRRHGRPKSRSPSVISISSDVDHDSDNDRQPSKRARQDLPYPAYHGHYQHESTGRRRERRSDSSPYRSTYPSSSYARTPTRHHPSDSSSSFILTPIKNSSSFSIADLANAAASAAPIPSSSAITLPPISSLSMPTFTFSPQKTADGQVSYVFSPSKGLGYHDN